MLCNHASKSVYDTYATLFGNTLTVYILMCTMASFEITKFDL